MKLVTRRPTTRSAQPTLPTDPCVLLALAEQQMYLLATGQSVAAVETPDLGRVEFSQANIGDLQRVIDDLRARCAAARGYPQGVTGRRRPISVEAWP